MKSGILALVSISSALVSCTSYERPPLFDQITGKIQGMSGRDDYLSGVGATSGVNTDLPPEARLGQGYWDLPAGTQGEKHIIIDLKQQKVFYYVGTTLVGVSPMSSGKEGYGTPRGTYKIIQKDANYIRRSAQQIHRSRRQRGLQRQGWRSAGRNLLRPRPHALLDADYGRLRHACGFCHRISGQPRLRAPAGGHGQDIL